MNKVFTKGCVTLIYANNLDYYKLLTDGEYDLLFDDPEYGIGADNPSLKQKEVRQRNGKKLNIKQKKYTKQNWDLKPADKSYFDEAFRVSKNQIIWGVNYYDYKFGPGRLVWNKLNGENDQLDCEIAYQSINKRTELVNYLWSGMMQGVTPSKDIRKAIVQIGNKKLNEERIHQCQKPTILNEWILLNFSKLNWSVLDGHFGSATLAVACYKLGIQYTGIENNLQNFENGVSFFEKRSIQNSLF